WTAASTNGAVAPAHVISTLMRTALSRGAHSSAAHRAFRFSNTPTTTWSANTGPKNGAHQTALFNASTRSATSTRGATRKFHSRNSTNAKASDSKKRPSPASSPTERVALPTEAAVTSTDRSKLRRTQMLSRLTLASLFVIATASLALGQKWPEPKA